MAKTHSTDLLDIYDQASGWTAARVKGATRKRSHCDVRAVQVRPHASFQRTRGGREDAPKT